MAQLHKLCCEAPLGGARFRRPAAVSRRFCAQRRQDLSCLRGGVAQKFADALELTQFRGTVSPQKLRRMVVRGQRLAQRAAAAQLKATAAERRRMLQDSQAWKSMLSNWRLVVAAMPDRPDLQAPFAFMQDYMSVTRSTPPQAPPAQ